VIAASQDAVALGDVDTVAAQAEQLEAARETVQNAIDSVRRRLRPTGHDCRQSAALVHLTQTPPGKGPTQPPPTTLRRRTRRIDHETAGVLAHGFECAPGKSVEESQGTPRGGKDG
jgi:hypothetical protein